MPPLSAMASVPVKARASQREAPDRFFRPDQDTRRQVAFWRIRSKRFGLFYPICPIQSREKDKQNVFYEDFTIKALTVFRLYYKIL